MGYKVPLVPLAQVDQQERGERGDPQERLDLQEHRGCQDQVKMVQLEQPVFQVMLVIQVG